MQQTTEKYCWIELAAMLQCRKMARGEYVRLQDADKIECWRKIYNDIDLFASVARYEKPDNNSESIVPLYFDIDSKDDLEGAREDAIRLCELLCDRIGISYDSLAIFFSGRKGFHVIVPVEVFCPRYSEHVLDLLKVMAQKAQAIGIGHLDSSVYTHKRILRLSNSKHGTSQLYKIPLTFKELRDIRMEGILELAQNPRPDDSYVQLAGNTNASTWFENAIRVVEKKAACHLTSLLPKSGFPSGWRKPPCIRCIENVTLPEGVRHTLYYQLSRYYAWLGMHPEGILEQIEEIDARNPIEDHHYIARTILSGGQKPGFPGCQNPVLEKFCNKENCFYYKLKSGEKNENTNCKIV